MTDQGSPIVDGLELRLADLASAIDLPPTPPMREAVLDGIRRRPSGRWRLAAIALALVVLAATVAALVTFGVGGLRLVPNVETLSPLPSGVVAERALGDRLSLDAARSRLAFEPRLPVALDAPDDVYVVEPPRGGALTLVWRDAAGGIGLLVTELRADIGPDAFEKLVIQGVTVQRTIVGEVAAWWVGGGEHPFFYRDANGAIVDTTLRLAEPTLFWEQDGITFRIEGARDIDDARRLAESIR